MEGVVVEYLDVVLSLVVLELDIQIGAGANEAALRGVK
jgi:hypothetical protein